FLPELEDPARWCGGYPLDDHEVGADHGLRIPALEVEEEVGSHVHIGCSLKAFLKRLEQIDDLCNVDLGLAQGLSVRLRIEGVVVAEGDRVHRSLPFSSRSRDESIPSGRRATASHRSTPAPQESLPDRRVANAVGSPRDPGTPWRTHRITPTS